ncbi:MAG: type II secretion system inner membrane protein GspF [Armatimonadota bacterium]|nr:MAG: type II secretion system inner membrane protein GspF [Armatimonadota bacterium]
MARFRYVALDRTGKTVTGEIAADNPEEVNRRLRDMGYFPSSVGEAAQISLGQRKQIRRGRGVRSTDVVVITRQLADMTAARLPMFRSLSVLVEQADRAVLRDLLEGIRTDVREGRPLSEALERHPRHFPELYVNMVRAGEASGHLDAVLLRLADFLEKSMQRRSQIISALLYPAVLITVAVGAVAFIIGFLIPKLSTLFTELEQTLPFVTRMLLAVANTLSATWWMLAVFVVVLVIGLRWYAHTEAGKESLDLLTLRLPLLGPIWHKMAVSRLARTLGTMLSGGVPILAALEISGNAVANRPLTRAVEGVREEVREGTSVAVALGRADVFPPLLIHMAGVGEETGQLPEMMTRVADTLDFEADSTLGRLTTLLEPFVIIIMGIIVGFIVLAVLLPIFQINATIGR